MRPLLVRLRSLTRSPGYTLAAVLTLAVGIGAGTAVFSVFNEVLLKPLPYPNAADLVQVNTLREGDGISMNYRDLQDYRAGVSSLTEMAGFARMNVILTGDQGAEQLRALAVGSALFDVLGTMPALGRPFRSEEDVWGTAPTVLLSHELWTGRYGSDPGVLGSTIRMDEIAHTVVGVMPPGFAFPDGIVLGSSDLWVPMGTYEGITEDRNSHPGIYAVGRLAPGRSVDGAEQELKAIADRLAQQYPDTNEGEGVEVRPALDAAVGHYASALWTVLIGSLLIFLIACSNVANLLLARAATRHRELAVRNALGAGRARIVALVLGESMALASAGALLGVAMGWALVRSSRVLLEGFPRADQVALDLQVVGFAAALSLLAALAAGLAPAIRSARAAAMAGLRSRDPGSSRVSAILVSGQVAITLALLLTAGLLGRSALNLQRADGGIQPDGVLTFRIGLPAAAYDSARTAPFFAELFDRIEAIPGTRSVGAISTLPFSGAGAQSGMRPAGEADGDPIQTDVAVVAHDYFETMGIRRLQGRLFEPGDGERTDPVVVVDERLAARFWPGQDPIGQQLGGWGFHTLTVVGVVQHVKNYGASAESREELYIHHGNRTRRNMNLVVRTDGDPTALVPAVRQAVASLDPNVPIQRPRAMVEVVERTRQSERLMATLSRTLSAIALVLAAMGLYALLSYRVRQSTAEIGIRMALGSTGGGIVARVVGSSLRMLAAGAVAGGALGLAAGFWLRGRLFGVSYFDPTALGVALATLGAVTLLASFVPAYRAAAIEPARVLRDE